MIQLEAIQAARQRIQDRLNVTPCLLAAELSDRVGADVYLKQESQQRTGSFKSRGALNKLLSLSDEERATGVIAASAGNHAQGVAWAAGQVGVDAHIVMPSTTPLIKVAGTREYGASVELHGANFDEAYERARQLQEERGWVFVHPFDDPLIIAGQGTCGLEIQEQVENLNAVVTPIGGGGLASGLAVAIKEQRPQVQIYGVQSDAAPSMKLSLDAGSIQHQATTPSIAEGITVKRPGELTFEHLAHYLDDCLVVSEGAIETAIFELLESARTVAEGAGAAAYAALASGQLPQLDGKRVTVVVSGANIDLNILNRIIERSLAKQHRLLRLHIRVKDRPGGLADLLAVIAREEANVLRIEHHRVFTDSVFWETDIELTLETRDRGHIEELVGALREAGYEHIEEVGVPLDPSPLRHSGHG